MGDLQFCDLSDRHDFLQVTVSYTIESYHPFLDVHNYINENRINWKKEEERCQSQNLFDIESFF